MDERQVPKPLGDGVSPLVPTGGDGIIEWLRELVRQFRLAWRLFWDRRVPWSIKLIPPAAFLYILSPIDILPDLSLGLGQLDDVAVLLLAIKLFIELCPVDVVREHLQALGARIQEWQAGEVIEGEFEVKESKQGEN
ncbi:MAG TPA: DUF1232 domain-containing protein [Thermoflexia bacterium]|nr:DUF1232 domain-containing protein [Thermoflexia bacterium]